MDAVETLSAPVPPAPAVPRSLRFVVGWAAIWGTAGAAIALGIVFVRGRIDDLGPLLLLSVQFAEVVGFTALASSRLVLPAFRRLSLASRIALQVVTVLAGTLFGSAAVIATQPLFALASPRTVAGIVSMNAVLAFLVSSALHTYDAMRRQIEASVRLLREKEAMERDLAIAREVQHELLPRSSPRIVGLELAGVCLPAIGVGGDAYDFVPLAEDKVAIVVADVAGKGIPAALLMAGLQASVRSLAPYLDPPGTIAALLNDRMQRPGPSARYATLFFGLLDGRQRTLRYTNCGHVPPLHLTREGVHKLESGGRPLGLFEGGTWEDGVCDLDGGDVVALFTDGIVETTDVKGLEFGEAHLAEILAAEAGKPLQDVMQAVLEARAAWSGHARPHDDVTLVLARVTDRVEETR
jgi:serine phosphatase RsbU (regulator of sigma subunit)